MVGARWSKFVVAVALAAACTACFAAPANAEGEEDTGGFGAFQLRASNGYRITAWAGSEKEFRHGKVVLLVQGKRNSVFYLAPARVTDTTIQADLGALGTIDLVFQPSGEEGRAAPVCDRSQRLHYGKGDYVGTVDFRGEEGYTRAHAKSVPFSLHPFIDFICPGYSRGEVVGQSFPGARLRARMKTAGDRIELQVNQNRPDARVEISASADESSGEIRIHREIRFVYPASVFDFASDLRKAALRPPAPFSGSSRYVRAAKPAHRWTGSLAVDFPGRSNVPLAGARFDPSLVHARFTEEHIHYDRPSRPNLTSWPSTKHLPTAFATPSLLAPR
jgi:hypothetical protein